MEAGQRGEHLRDARTTAGSGVPPGRDDPADRGRRRGGDPARQRRGGGAAAPDRRARRVRSSGCRRRCALDDDPASAAFVERALRRSMWDPGLGLFRDGVLRVPGRDPVDRADLAGAFDLIGFSYYAAIGVRRRPAEAVHPRGRRPSRRSATASGADGVGAGPRPAPRGAARRRCSSPSSASAPTTTTSGRPTSRDGLRSSHDAIDRGVDVRGFFHWTSVDNYEWIARFRRRASASSTSIATSSRAPRCWRGRRHDERPARPPLNGHVRSIRSMSRPRSLSRCSTPIIAA